MRFRSKRGAWPKDVRVFTHFYGAEDEIPHQTWRLAQSARFYAIL